MPPLRNFLASWMGLVTSLVFSDGVFSPLDGDLGMICNDTRDWLVSDSIQTWVGGVEGTGREWVLGGGGGGGAKGDSVVVVVAVVVVVVECIDN